MRADTYIVLILYQAPIYFIINSIININFLKKKLLKFLFSSEEIGAQRGCIICPLSKWQNWETNPDTMVP